MAKESDEKEGEVDHPSSVRSAAAFGIPNRPAKPAWLACVWSTSAGVIKTPIRPVSPAWLAFSSEGRTNAKKSLRIAESEEGVWRRAS